MNPKEILFKAAEIQDTKGQDYTTNVNLDQFENFNRTATVVKWFKDSQDQVFVSLIVTKIARLAALLGRKSPNHESIEDTFVDLVNYCALWGGKRMEWVTGPSGEKANPEQLNALGNLISKMNQAKAIDPDGNKSDQSGPWFDRPEKFVTDRDKSFCDLMGRIKGWKFNSLEYNELVDLIRVRTF